MPDLAVQNEAHVGVTAAVVTSNVVGASVVVVVVVVAVDGCEQTEICFEMLTKMFYIVDVRLNLCLQKLVGLNTLSKLK